MKGVRTKSKAFSVVFLGAVLIVMSTPAFARVGAWETLAPMPTARWGTVSGVIGGKLYVAGGSDGANSLAALEVYDPATDTWSTRAPMPTARDGAGGGVIDGKLYVVGGASGQKLSTLEVYDPDTNTWATRASMSTPRSKPGVAAIDGKLYVAGGCVGWCAPVTSTLEVYDPAGDTWSTKAPLPTARGNVATAVVNGLFYVMGGCCGGTGAESDLMAVTIEVYDPTADTWSSRNQHEVGAAYSAGTIDGKIYVAKFDTAEVSDPATDAWGSISPLSISRHDTAGSVIDGKFYVVGGYYGANVGVAALEMYTPFTSASPDYFPLSVGNTWIYDPSFGAGGNRVDTISGEEMVNGVHTYTWNRQEAPDDNYNEKRWLAKDNTGVSIYKLWSNEGPDPAVTIDPPFLVFKSNPNVGDTFIGEFEPSSGILFTVTSYIEAIDDAVTVPAGTFANCVRIRVLNETTENTVTTAVGWYKEWYAPNVGCVIYAKYDADWASPLTTQELIGFSVTRGLPGDVNLDGKLGLDDAIHTLQVVSGTRK